MRPLLRPHPGRTLAAALRGGLGPPRNTDRYITSDSYWQKPLSWNRKAAANDTSWGKNWQPSVRGGQRRLVFTASMADVFEFHPQLDLVRERLWKLIEATPYLDWQILTKRPMNIKRMYPKRWLENPPHNVWLGTSVGLQKWADLRIPALLEVPAVVHFLSCEPLLGPLNLEPYWARVVLLWRKDHRRRDRLGDHRRRVRWGPIDPSTSAGSRIWTLSASAGRWLTSSSRSVV